MITIVNKHQDSHGIYVGRPTVLGNPYTLKVYTRTDAIERYRIWLRQQWQRQGEVQAELLQLARQYHERGALTLVCWCAPRRCHAEVIREAVLGIVQHGLVERPPGHDRPPGGRGAAPPAAPPCTSGGLMKLIIAGSRTFADYQRLCQVLAPDRHRIAQVLTGGARGADQLGYRWAWKHVVRHQRFRAEWERFGTSAGMRRNHQMAQAGDVLVACWDGQSPGTAHLIQCMEQLGKPVVVVRSAP
ncbi:MAG: DUF4326 domain-containing protein [Candidatus Tectimicrobiota bacterium]